MKLFLKKWIFEKGAKTNDVSAESLLVRRLFEGPTMTYGGDEEIVLKGGAKKALRLEKTVK
jgi:hypothetical protein